MERIMIMGPPGAGKSTLAQNLSKVLGIEALHLDTEFWAAGWNEAPKDQFKKAQEEFLKKEKWIIDGNYRRWLGEKRLEKADTIIHLDFSTWNCLYGVIKRRIIYHGKTRPDLAEGCPEKIDWHFLKFTWNYNRNSTPGIKEAIAGQKGKKVFVLKNRWEVDNFVEEVRKSKKENREVEWNESS